MADLLPNILHIDRLKQVVASQEIGLLLFITAVFK